MSEFFQSGVQIIVFHQETKYKQVSSHSDQYSLIYGTKTLLSHIHSINQCKNHTFYCNSPSRSPFAFQIGSNCQYLNYKSQICPLLYLQTLNTHLIVIYHPFLLLMIKHNLHIYTFHNNSPSRSLFTLILGST